MHIAPDIPDNIPNVAAPDQDPARTALEAMALEGYRSERLSEYDVREFARVHNPHAGAWLPEGTRRAPALFDGGFGKRHSGIGSPRGDSESAQVLRRAVRRTNRHCG